MIKICGIVIIALFAVILLKNKNSEFSLLVIICTVVLIFLAVSNDLYTIIKHLSAMTESVGSVQPYINLMLKILGLSMLSQFVSDLCRDCGENALASQTELAAKIIILIMTVPLFESVIEVVTGLLK